MAWIWVLNTASSESAAIIAATRQNTYAGKTAHERGPGRGADGVARTAGWTAVFRDGSVQR